MDKSTKHLKFFIYFIVNYFLLVYTAKEIAMKNISWTAALGLPEPEGTFTFSGVENEVMVTLFDGGVTVDEYFVYVEFDWD